MKVTLQNLTKKYPSRNKKQPQDVIAVNDFSFEIPDGKLIGLLGPSGCGKSPITIGVNKLAKITQTKPIIGAILNNNVVEEEKIESFFINLTKS